ncbi:DUF3349 domain-containing protein [Mycobacteroides abscessus]|uniref:DUF3349 domain-containing protein n=2 Tax=Mycobacteroides abscessus subsp. bolletii TaxID=319705 RepID=A0A829HRZ9_9MYCO|nr:hypothetical protein MASS_3964 [Mycobacteroides abscessus subsp. bolletii 50594]AWG53079.1 DUF3349 domain-containing protein [Mycobacteroides abscessus]EHM17245.1 hypothetical protein MBOL_38310 [Mycobacteroides abscessus subsp. bolletii BD]EPQ22281.1 hypothetical protein J108_18775 [Mycobacteroides abscessus subsp. bolletii CRM-0020]ORA30472.1 hypothetical protein BST18_02900 [Mycobacteroides abscessus subsp. bolletii]ORA90243.1 hypothetical protein BST32_12605 [Mycobacteroides abscessus s
MAGDNGQQQHYDRYSVDKIQDGRPSLQELEAVNAFLNKIVTWLRAGYPEGVPPPDYVPLLALLGRRLSNDEVKTVARELMARGDFDNIDIGVLITQITDELPTGEDIERVRERLAKKGWPLDDPREPADHGEEPGSGQATDHPA